MNALVVTKLVGFGAKGPQQFTSHTVTVGTDHGCDIKFDPAWDKTVSPRHCHLQFDGRQWVLFDDGSARGTRLNGRPLTAPTPLAAAAEIELGQGGPRIRCEPVVLAAPGGAAQAAAAWQPPVTGRPGQVSAIAALTMISGVLNCLAAMDLIFGVALLYTLLLKILSVFGFPGLRIFTIAPLCQIIPPVFILSLGIMEIIYAAKILPDPMRVKKPAKFIAVMQIVSFIFGNFLSLVTGILALSFYATRRVSEYFRNPPMQPMGPGTPPPPSEGNGFGAGLVGAVVGGAFLLVVAAHLIAGAFALVDAEDAAQLQTRAAQMAQQDLAVVSSEPSVFGGTAYQSASPWGAPAPVSGAGAQQAAGGAAADIAPFGKPLLQTPGQWEPFVAVDNQIFPSYILATSVVQPPTTMNAGANRVLGDQNGLIGIRIKSPAFRAPVRVEITGSELIEPSVFEGVLEQGNVEYTVFPKINYRYEALKNARQATPANLSWRVFLGNSDLGQKTQTVRVRSVNDCPFFIFRNRKGQTEEAQGVVPMTWMFAAYANEHHPSVEVVLKDALNSKIVNEFAGYQKPPEGVLMEVFAIWHALQARGVKYSNITTPSAESEFVVSQHVRFLEESLGNAQANCVDGTVLFASILRKIGVSPMLVLIPGHMYLGFSLDRDLQQVLFLETTMLGSVDIRAAKAFGDAAPFAAAVSPVLDKIRATGPSGESFASAVGKASALTRQNEAQFRRPGSLHQIMQLDLARKHGIDPIGYSGATQQGRP